MWRLGYYRGITWKMLMSDRVRAYKVVLNGAEHATWQWTDFRLAKDYAMEEWVEAVAELIPYGYVWAIVKDPAYAKPSILGTLLAKKGGRIGFF